MWQNKPAAAQSQENGAAGRFNAGAVNGLFALAVCLVVDACSLPAPALADGFIFSQDGRFLVQQLAVSQFDSSGGNIYK